MYHAPESLPTLTTQCECQCVIKSIKIHLFSNQKLFGCYTPMIIYIQTHVSFMGRKFSGSHRRLCKCSNTFWTFTLGVSEPVRVFHPRENLAFLAITRHKFILLFNAIVRLGWTLSNGNHALTLIPCDVLVHM